MRADAVAGRAWDGAAGGPRAVGSRLRVLPSTRLEAPARSWPLPHLGSRRGRRPRAGRAVLRLRPPPAGAPTAVRSAASLAGLRHEGTRRASLASPSSPRPRAGEGSAACGRRTRAFAEPSLGAKGACRWPGAHAAAPLAAARRWRRRGGGPAGPHSPAHLPRRPGRRRRWWRKRLGERCRRREGRRSWQGAARRADGRGCLGRCRRRTP